MPGPFRERTKSPFAAQALTLLVLAVLSVVDSLGKTSDPDVFWHLSTARAALATRSFLPHDLFSYSARNAPWVYKDLVAELALYLGFVRFGFAWFAVLKAAVAASFVAAACVVAPHRDRARLAVLVGAGLIIDSFWLIERPNMFGMALFALVIAFIERARRSATNHEVRAIATALAPVVLLNIVWTWIHRFALLGHLLFAGFACLLLAAYALRRARAARSLLSPAPSLRFAIAAAVAAVLVPPVSLLNPNGLATFTSGAAMAAHPELRSHLMEWKQVGLAEQFRAFPVATVLAATTLVAIAAGVVRAVREGDDDPPVTLWHAAVLLALVALTATGIRWLPYLAVASGLYLTVVLARVVAERPAPKGATALAALMVLGLLLWRRVDDDLGVGEDETWSPRGATTFAAAHGLTGRVANAFDFGGYLMWKLWPSVELLVDGRNELVYDLGFVYRCLEAEHDAKAFAAMREGDHATWAVAVNSEDYVVDGFLARAPGWGMVYWSDTAAVYVRRDAHPDLAPLVYRYVDPLDVPLSVAFAIDESRGDPAILTEVLVEVRRMLDASPASLRANTALLALLPHLGPAFKQELDALRVNVAMLTRDSPRLAAEVRALRE